jgi:hypothetical protein
VANELLLTRFLIRDGVPPGLAQIQESRLIRSRNDVVVTPFSITPVSFKPLSITPSSDTPVSVTPGETPASRAAIES